MRRTAETSVGEGWRVFKGTPSEAQNLLRRGPLEFEPCGDLVVVENALFDTFLDELL